MKKGFQFLLGFLLLIQGLAFGQNKFAFADREYKKMRYANAIEAYEDAMHYAKAEASDYVNLADSYYRIGDSKNAERVYALYVSLPQLVNPDAGAMFQYAQTLAQNGKYEEAATWFEKYHKMKTVEDDTRGDDFLKAYRHNIHDFYKDSVLYDVYRLDINSPQSDFSPTFYKKGIVFTSSRKMENWVRRVHSWNNTAFLNLYYLDTSAVNERVYNTHIGQEHAAHNTYSYISANAKLHTDETYVTSNDSRTLGYHAHIFNKDTNENHSSDPKLFGEKLNSKFHDGPCAFNKTQDMVVLTRNNLKGGMARRGKDGVNRLGLYSSTIKDSAGWSKPLPLPFNSKEYSTAYPTFAADGKTMYFASDMPGGFGGMDLYKTSYDGSNWSKPENLGHKINTEGNEVFPFVDEHGVIYFSSNGHPGLGGLDLFTFEDGKVKHLNYPLSSKKDDFGIAVWADGRKGYLSSNRDFGGFDDDLYYFQASKAMLLAGKTIDNVTKQPLKNARVVLTDEAGKVIAETVSDEEGDYSMQVEHDKVFKLKGTKEQFHDADAQVSTKGVRGQTINKDLMLWTKFDVRMLGLITDRQTNEPLSDVHVRIVNAKTGEEIFNDSTGNTGNFKNALLGKKHSDTIDLDVHLARDKYLSKTIKFNTVVTDSGEIKLHEKLDLKMDKAEIGTDIGKVFHLNPIYFDFSKSEIRTDAAAELDKIVAIMQENPTIVIELQSHTDCRSSAAANQSLSDKRAKASAAYVISKGISKARIYGKGYGESRLKNDCGCEGNKTSTCTEEEHQLNRRTEFVIVKM